MKVLLVEDEVRLTDALSHLLKQKNIEVDIANDGDSGLLFAEREIYDVIILDIMLPGKSGLEILRTIRKKGDSTPVLLLTARDSVEDRVVGLDTGADDYLIKPFAMAELLARVRALSRRIASPFTGEKLSVGNIQLDISNNILLIEEESFKLTVKETKLLEIFIRRPGQVFSKEQILKRVWGYDSDIQENNIEIHVHNLRRKLENKANITIVTVRGIGYTIKERLNV